MKGQGHDETFNVFSIATLALAIAPWRSLSPAAAILRDATGLYFRRSAPRPCLRARHTAGTRRRVKSTAPEDVLSVLSVEHQVDLSAERDGVVVSLAKDEGSAVKAGDILGQLDDRTSRWS